MTSTYPPPQAVIGVRRGQELYIGRFEGVDEDGEGIVLLMNHLNHQEPDFVLPSRPDGVGVFHLRLDDEWRLMSPEDLPSDLVPATQLDQIDPQHEHRVHQFRQALEDGSLLRPMGLDPRGTLLTTPVHESARIDFNQRRLWDLVLDFQEIFPYESEAEVSLWGSWTRHEKGEIDSTVRKKFTERLESFEEIDPKKLVDWTSHTQHQLIVEKRMEREEGERLLDRVETALKLNRREYRKFNPFRDLHLVVQHGYLHLIRRGYQLSPRLARGELLDPEEYLRGAVSPEIVDQGTQMHLLALHPDPRYFSWILVRLMMAWYADPVLSESLLRVKILVNQWRMSNRVSNNQILPGMILYPKGGALHAKQVLLKLSHYLDYYAHLGLKVPIDGFLPYNQLIYYTTPQYLREYHQQYLQRLDYRDAMRYI